MKILQAGAVAIGGRAILIEGAPGSGKSTLALGLIDRGAQLIGDDGTTLLERGGWLWAAPPPSTAGLIEIRNVGLVELPVTTAPVALFLRLDEAAPRFRDNADTRSFGSFAVPLVTLDPRLPALPLRAEYALRQFGLPVSRAET